jgi:hypothetical protein
MGRSLRARQARRGQSAAGGGAGCRGAGGGARGGRWRSRRPTWPARRPAAAGGRAGGGGGDGAVCATAEQLCAMQSGHRNKGMSYWLRAGRIGGCRRLRRRAATLCWAAAALCVRCWLVRAWRMDGCWFAVFGCWAQGSPFDSEPTTGLSA